MLLKFIFGQSFINHHHCKQLQYHNILVSSVQYVPVAQATIMGTSALWTKFVSEAKGEVNFSLPLWSCVDIPRGTHLCYIAELNHCVGNNKKQNTFYVALASEQNTSEDPASCCSFQEIIAQSQSLLTDSFRSVDNRDRIANPNDGKKHYFLSVYGIRRVNKARKKHKQQATSVRVVSTVCITVQEHVRAWVNYGATTTDVLNRAYAKTAYDRRTFRGRGLYNLLMQLVSSTSLSLTGNARVSLQCPSDLVESYQRMGFISCTTHSLQIGRAHV